MPRSLDAQKPGCPEAWIPRSLYAQMPVCPGIWMPICQPRCLFAAPPSMLFLLLLLLLLAHSWMPRSLDA